MTCTREQSLNRVKLTMCHNEIDLVLNYIKWKKKLYDLAPLKIDVGLLDLIEQDKKKKE